MFFVGAGGTGVFPVQLVERRSGSEVIRIPAKPTPQILKKSASSSQVVMPNPLNVSSPPSRVLGSAQVLRMPTPIKPMSNTTSFRVIRSSDAVSVQSQVPDSTVEIRTPPADKSQKGRGQEVPVLMSVDESFKVIKVDSSSSDEGNDDDGEDYICISD